MSNGGGLPTDQRYVPTCTSKPLAGMWIDQTGNPTIPFSQEKVAIARAMRVNGCTIGTSYDDAQFVDFPIGDTNPNATCRKIQGCPEATPIIVCALPGNASTSNDNVANPGFSTFIRLFEPPMPPDATPPPPPPGGGAACGFTMPNAASTGLPNLATYVANADGTVTDMTSGLIWEGGAGADSQMRPSADAYCRSKGDGWRLPTRLELVSLLDVAAPLSFPAINWTYFPGTRPLGYWTSSDYAGASGFVWTVSFLDGTTAHSLRVDDGTEAPVRCVRAPAPRCASPRYQIQRDGFVLDETTGLTWEQQDTGALTWSAAMTRCASLGPGWRLPSLNELQTIVDDTKSAPAIDRDVFPLVSGGAPCTPAVPVNFWTSSAFSSAPVNKWIVSFGDGTTSFKGPTESSRARCVR